MTGRSWGHGNGFAKPHAHDGVAVVLKGTATTVLTIGGARCSWQRTRNNRAGEKILAFYAEAGTEDSQGQG